MMEIISIPNEAVKEESADEIAKYFDRLWPLFRSITGDGVRQTHDILSELIPLQREEIPSGTEVLDWTVPQEWKVNAAYVVTPEGQRILDVKENNLHLLNYSIPFKGKMTREELDKHLFSLPQSPDAIPYVTSYYAPKWGFCLSDNERSALPDGVYDVVIDAELFDGSMTLSEAVLPGETSEEVLISTYTCHPSMANNELSGPLVAAFLYKRLAQLKTRRLTYRFVFLPETIGAIAYLNRIGEHLKEHLVAGYVLTCIGDSAPFTLKKSRQGNTVADRAANHVLTQQKHKPKILAFFPSGSDERQYCSPGYDLPVCVLARSIYNDFPEYHTSLDNRDFISFEHMTEAIGVCFQVCLLLEKNQVYKNLVSKGEPKLSKYGLMSDVGAQRTIPNLMRVCQWLLSFCDGDHSLLDIAERSGESFWELETVAQKCKEIGLLEVVLK